MTPLTKEFYDCFTLVCFKREENRIVYTMRCQKIGKSLESDKQTVEKTAKSKKKAKSTLTMAEEQFMVVVRSWCAA